MIGLKGGIMADREPSLSRLNRTMIGLKDISAYYIGLILLSLNRTIIGLKADCPPEWSEPKTCKQI